MNHNLTHHNGAKQSKSEIRFGTMVFMKRALLCLTLLLCSAAAMAQTGIVQNHCYLGGTKATTSGQLSSNYLNGIIPGCTVTVYLTGTTNKATITTPTGGILSNPFTANQVPGVDPGGWAFQAATNQGLDIVMSGGNNNQFCNTAPLCYTSPVTLIDVFPSSSFNPVSGVLSINGSQGAFSFTGNATCTGTSCNFFSSATTVFQHNATNLPNQALLNFLDTPASLNPPALDVGYTPINFKNDTHGGLAAEVLASGSQFSAYLIPPTTGQFVNLCSGTQSGSGSDSSQIFTFAPCGGAASASGGPIGAPHSASVTWSNYTLPSYVNPANVTAVYAVILMRAQTSGIGSWTFVCSASNVGTTSVTATRQFNTLLAGVTGANINSVSCTVAAAHSGGNAGTFTYVGATVELFAFYTGTPPPVVNQVNVQPPLNWDPSTQVLSLDVPPDLGTDSGTTNNYQVTLGSGNNLLFNPGLTVNWLPGNTNTTTTPTLIVNGVLSGTIENSRGGAIAAGDISSSAVAVVILGPDHNWWLQNPQVSGTGGAVSSVSNSDSSLTISPTTGSVVASLNPAHSNTWTAAQTMPAPTLSNVTGSTQCLQANSSGVVSGTGSTCGAGAGGVTSLNSLTGALTATSADTSVYVSPSGTSIDLSAKHGIIYDDDCANDQDCAVNAMPLLGRLYNTGQVKLLAIINDNSNTAAAPAMHILASFYGMGALPLGAWLGAVPSSNTTGNVSAWTAPLVSQFNPGDVNTNYPSCVTVYRQVLVAAPALSVKIVSTGFLTCIDALLTSGADSISSLTGAQLIQAKVTELDIMGGFEPSTGSNEFNFQQDAVSAQDVLATWTSGNGYPPIYFSGVNNGATSVISGVSSSYPNTDPSAYVGSLTTYTRPSWDALAIYEAVSGPTSLWSISANGTNTITSTSGGSAGTNSFSTGSSSGHFYLTLTAATAFYQYFLNGALAAQGSNSVVVNAVNKLSGAVTIAAGSGATVTTAGSTVTVATTGTGVSGMTAGQVPIAASATTITSSKALAGSGSGITTGPASTTSGDCVSFTGTTGQISDAGAPCGTGAGGVTSVSNSDSTLTISPTTGAVVSSLNLAHANSWTAGQTVTISSSTLAPINSVNNNSSSFISTGFLTCPNMTSGQTCYQNVGHDGSTNNEVGFNFLYQSSGSSSNSALLNFFGSGARQEWWANGDVSIGSTSDPGKQLGVGSSNQLTVDPSGNLVTSGSASSATLKTATNCANAASPAVCGSAAAGAVTIAAGSTTVQVNTSAVTANSEIFLQTDDTLTIPSTTCNSTLATLVGGIAITARSAGTSFTISFNGVIATNPLCISYRIVN